MYIHVQVHIKCILCICLHGQSEKHYACLIPACLTHCALILYIYYYPLSSSISYNVPRLKASSRVNGILLRYNDNDTSQPDGWCPCTCIHVYVCVNKYIFCIFMCVCIAHQLYKYMYMYMYKSVCTNVHSVCGSFSVSLMLISFSIHCI